jgi:hypothetical protein
MEAGRHSLAGNAERPAFHDEARHQSRADRLGSHLHVGARDVQEKQDFEATAKVEELDADLEASLRTCHHMVAEYRAMLIAAYGESPSPDEDCG